MGEETLTPPSYKCHLLSDILVTNESSSRGRRDDLLDGTNRREKKKNQKQVLTEYLNVYQKQSNDYKICTICGFVCETSGFYN